MSEDKKTVYFKEIDVQAFIVEMSNKRNVQIDPDEIEKVYKGWASGNPIRVRQGIINPSFIVDIVLDEHRVREHRDEFYKIEAHQRLGLTGQRTYKGMRQLKDIFTDLPKLNQLNSGSKQLSTGKDN